MKHFYCVCVYVCDLWFVDTTVESSILYTYVHTVHTYSKIARQMSGVGSSHENEKKAVPLRMGKKMLRFPAICILTKL